MEETTHSVADLVAGAALNCFCEYSHDWISSNFRREVRKVGLTMTTLGSVSDRALDGVLERAFWDAWVEREEDDEGYLPRADIRHDAFVSACELDGVTFARAA